MTTDFDYETDEERAEREASEAAEAQRQGADPHAAARRRAEKERDDARREAADLRAKNAAYERREALDTATRELGAQGPLGAFLRTYSGEPTADAIRAAVAADADFATLVTFPPDPRDLAAQTQASAAAKMAGGAATTGQITYETYVSWPLDTRLRFNRDHPEASKSLREGNPVPTPVGWA